MIPVTEPLIRVRDLPGHAPYAAPLIDLLANLHDEPGDWTVSVNRVPARLEDLLGYSWSVNVRCETREVGVVAAGVLGLNHEKRAATGVVWMGKVFDEDTQQPCSVAVFAPAAPDTSPLVEKLRDLVDEAELAGQHAEAETLRVALTDLRGGDTR